MFRIYRESPHDTPEVEYLYDLAFAPGRTALSSYRLRDGVDPVSELSLVARDEYDVLAGAIRFWPVRVGVRGDAALLLGPVAVHPTRQGEGLGALLINESLHKALTTDWTRVILVGDEPYYRRFGFSRATASKLSFPPPTNPDRLLARELVPGAFCGVGGLVQNWAEWQPRHAGNFRL
ncbi:MAG: N-acetyltransferase [Rhodobacteraceae bacterium]|nr:N-acetyltransferase [Paracoccaceae bacterium]